MYIYICIYICIDIFFKTCILAPTLLSHSHFLNCSWQLLRLGAEPAPHAPHAALGRADGMDWMGSQQRDPWLRKATIHGEYFLGIGGRMIFPNGWGW